MLSAPTTIQINNWYIDHKIITRPLSVIKIWSSQRIYSRVTVSVEQFMLMRIEHYQIVKHPIMCKTYEVLPVCSTYDEV